jgi:hypothetical protein
MFFEKFMKRRHVDSNELIFDDSTKIGNIIC